MMRESIRVRRRREIPSNFLQDYFHLATPDRWVAPHRGALWGRGAFDFWPVDNGPIRWHWFRSPSTRRINPPSVKPPRIKFFLAPPPPPEKKKFQVFSSVAPGQVCASFPCPLIGLHLILQSVNQSDANTKKLRGIAPVPLSICICLICLWLCDSSQGAEFNVGSLFSKCRNVHFFQLYQIYGRHFSPKKYLYFLFV